MRHPSIKVLAGAAAMVCAIGAASAATMAPGVFAATGSSAVATGATAHHAHRGPSGLRGAIKDLTGYLKLTRSQLMKDLRQGQTLAQVAATQGISQQSLLTELQNLVNTRISQAVSKGRLTQAQATAREQKIDAKLPQWITSAWPTHQKHQHMLSMRSEMLNEVASLLQLSPKTLTADLKSGESIDQVAAAKGVSTQQLTQELENALAARINSMVPTFLQHTRPKAK